MARRVLDRGVGVARRGLRGHVQHTLPDGRVEGEPFPVPPVNIEQVGLPFLRHQVDYPTTEPPGTIVIDPAAHFLYHVEPGGRAMRYGVGVGREGFGWSGTADIRFKREWPNWYPPQEMIELIETSRVFEANVNMVKFHDSMLESIVERVMKS